MTRRRSAMIVCLRTALVPPEMRDRYRAWISQGKAVREARGVLAEWVLEPADTDGDTVVVTVWPWHEVFDAWIATPERDALTASAVHQAATYRPIVRYDLAAGYTNVAGFAALPDPHPMTAALFTEEDQP